VWSVRGGLYILSPWRERINNDADRRQVYVGDSTAATSPEE
jgi:hypothetical protein